MSEILDDLAALQTQLFEFHVTHRDNYPSDNFRFLFNQVDEAIQDMLGELGEE